MQSRDCSRPVRFTFRQRRPGSSRTEQILKFPSGKRDDIVDALTLALERTAEAPFWKTFHSIFGGDIAEDDEAELEQSEEEVEKRLVN